jgi:hypothetical protein
MLLCLLLGAENRTASVGASNGTSPGEPGLRDTLAQTSGDSDIGAPQQTGTAFIPIGCIILQPGSGATRMNLKMPKVAISFILAGFFRDPGDLE